MSPQGANSIICLRCHSQVTFAELGLLEETSPGFWHVVWQCACGIREHKGPLRQDALDGILDGWAPELPYAAVPLPPAELCDASEEAIANLYVALVAVVDVPDFLAFCKQDTERSQGSEQ